MSNEVALAMPDDQNGKPVQPFGIGTRKTWSSLPLDSIQDKQTFYLMQVGESEGLKDVVNLVINVRAVAVQEWQKEIENGEVVDMFRIILILDDGRMIGSSAKGLRRSLSQYCEIFGLPTDWPGPVPFLVKQITLPPDPKDPEKKPRFTYDLIAQFPAQDKAKPGTKGGAK